MQDFRHGADIALVQTTAGPVQGYQDNGVSIFRGIPYGTAERFHAPQPVEPWETPFDATSYGYVCPLMAQEKPVGELKVPHRYWLQDENCLNLNVWTPNCGGEKRPVMVWLHGGGYFAGSSIEQVAYEGENMARLGDCVVVSLNHRLNILGFFDLSDFGDEYENSGNAGLDDIILALRWVRDNIAAFGGDPGNVTLFGQSGGGAKTTALLQMPAADGLFRQCINMSGVIPELLADSVGSGRLCAQAVMAELGINAVKDLERVPYAQLVVAYNKVSPALAGRGENVGCTPHPNAFYAGDPQTNGKGFRRETLDVPILAGTVLGEFSGFRNGLAGGSLTAAVGQEKAERLYSLFKKAFPERDRQDVLMLDTVFRAPLISYIRKRAEQGGRIYSYLFAQDFPLYGRNIAWHCADIPFVFHNTELVPVCHFEGAKELEERIFRAVMEFARTGQPGWQASTPQTEHTMIFGPACRLVQNHDHELMGELLSVADQISSRMASEEPEILH